MASWTEFLDARAPAGRYLRWKEVERTTGLSRTTAWRLQRKGDFPRPYVISPGRVGYLESEVEAWRASRRRRTTQAAPSQSDASALEAREAQDASGPPVGPAGAGPSRQAQPRAAAGRPGRRASRAVATVGVARQITFDF